MALYPSLCQWQNQNSLCNAPEDTPMEVLNRVATMRWPIEQCFEECKSHLGMGHVEARSYKAWPTHVVRDDGTSFHSNIAYAP